MKGSLNAQVMDSAHEEAAVRGECAHVDKSLCASPPRMVTEEELQIGLLLSHCMWTGFGTMLGQIPMLGHEQSDLFPGLSLIFNLLINCTTGY